MNFTFKAYKNISQDVITIVNYSGYDFSSTTTISATVYLVAGTTINTYAFTSQNISDLNTNGRVDITTADLLGASPVDGYYTISLDVDSTDTGTGYVGITLAAASQVNSHQSLIDVRPNKYDIPLVLHLSKILLDGMNALEYTDTTQGKNQFDNWNTRLKETLNYA